MNSWDFHSPLVDISALFGSGIELETHVCALAANEIRLGSFGEILIGDHTIFASGGVTLCKWDHSHVAVVNLGRVRLVDLPLLVGLCPRTCSWTWPCKDPGNFPE